MIMTLYTDGGARGNPGPAGSGAVLYDQDGSEIAAVKQFLGHATNNTAEYTAIIIGMEEAKKRGATHLNVRMDSELAVRQLTGVYRVKQPHLQTLFLQVKRLQAQFDRVEYTHVRREQNVRADALANEAMDEGMKKI